MVQEHIGAVAYEMLSRGASVNDKDGLTDMSLLHFAAKSGARGLGDMGKVGQTPPFHRSLHDARYAQPTQPPTLVCSSA
jgi:hypothetical protein